MVVPGPDPDAWPGMTFLWTGWDGSVWNVGARRFGTFIKAARGLDTPPPFQRFTSRSASAPGTRYLGSRADEREVFWRLRTYSPAGSQAWIDRDRAFWRTLNPRRPGVWTVRQASGEERHLTCRFAQAESTVDTDPSRTGWGRYEVFLVAEDPFWRGAPILRSWRPSSPVGFFGESGGPPFHISSGSALVNATITNPGDEPSHPVWVVHGPVDSVSVGLADGAVDVPFAVPDGQALVVDTRPARQIAEMIDAPPAGSSVQDLVDWIAAHPGTDRTRDLGATTRFRPVPAGKSVPLTLSMVGAGSVSMLLTPHYHRAW
jgi:hypothetical protein